MSKKVALEGMSRGGLIVFNWAEKNAEKVSSIYADAIVCDVRSWPCSDLTEFKGEKNNSKTCQLLLRAYNLTKRV